MMPCMWILYYRNLYKSLGSLRDHKALVGAYNNLSRVASLCAFQWMLRELLSTSIRLSLY